MTAMKAPGNVSSSNVLIVPAHIAAMIAEQTGLSIEVINDVHNRAHTGHLDINELINSAGASAGASGGEPLKCPLRTAAELDGKGDAPFSKENIEKYMKGNMKGK